jgi:hypothetical protein
MNSSVGYYSLSRAGKLSPQGDFFKIWKIRRWRVHRRGVAKCSPTRSRLNAQHSEVEEVYWIPTPTKLHGWEGNIALLWEFQSCWTQFCILGTRLMSVVLAVGFSTARRSDCFESSGLAGNWWPAERLNQGRFPMRNAIAAGNVFRYFKENFKLVLQLN